MFGDKIVQPRQKNQLTNIRHVNFENTRRLSRIEALGLRQGNAHFFQQRLQFFAQCNGDLRGCHTIARPYKQRITQRLSPTLHHQGNSRLADPDTQRGLTQVLTFADQAESMQLGQRPVICFVNIR